MDFQSDRVSKGFQTSNSSFALLAGDFNMGSLFPYFCVDASATSSYLSVNPYIADDLGQGNAVQAPFFQISEDLIPDLFPSGASEIINSKLYQQLSYTTAKRSILSRQFTDTLDSYGQAAEDYVNQLVSACHSRSAGIAFGVIAWYDSSNFKPNARLLWSLTLAVALLTLWHWLRGFQPSSVPPVRPPDVEMSDDTKHEPGVMLSPVV